MMGLVFTGDKLPEKIEYYRLVVYLLNEGYNNQPAITLENLYNDSIGKSNIDELAQFMSVYGFFNQEELKDLIFFSEKNFISFMNLVAKRHMRVLRNIRNDIISENLKIIFRGLNSRCRDAVIVGETSNIPFINIESFLADNRLSNIRVCGDFRRSYLYDSKKESLVLIDGNYLAKGVDSEKTISEGVPVFISRIKYGRYMPNVIDPEKNRVYMIDDLASGTISVGKDALVFAF